MILSHAIARSEAETLSIHASEFEANVESTIVIEAIDSLTLGIGAVDQRCHLLFANEALQNILALDDGLALHLGDLRACHAEDTELLRRHVQTVLRSGGVKMTSVKRSSGLPPLLMAVRAPSREQSPGSGRFALVFVAEPGRRCEFDPALARSLFGLTRAEGRVAFQIANGRRAEEIALSLGVSLSTIRSHVKSILAKLNVDRQIRVALSVLSLLGSLRQ